MSVEINCENCGSANYSLPAGDIDAGTLLCNDCGAEQGSLGELKAKPTQIENPFLAPWVNRIDQDAYWANGKKDLLIGAIGFGPNLCDHKFALCKGGRLNPSKNLRHLRLPRIICEE